MSNSGPSKKKKIKNVVIGGDLLGYCLHSIYDLALHLGTPVYCKTYHYGVPINDYIT